MSKGRNTTVVGVRLPDEMVANLKKLARSRRRTVSESMKDAVSDFIASSNLSSEQKNTISTGKTPEQETKKEESFPKVGRNDPCPCGSGNKYKKCHGL